MFIRRRHAILVVLAVIGLMCLFPPWIVYHEVEYPPAVEEVLRAHNLPPIGQPGYFETHYRFVRASLFWQDGFDVYQGQLDFFRFVLQLLVAGALLAWLLKRPVRSYIMLLPPPASSRYALLNGRNDRTERPARPPRTTPRDRRDRRIGTQ